MNEFEVVGAILGSLAALVTIAGEADKAMDAKLRKGIVDFLLKRPGAKIMRFDAIVFNTTIDIFIVGNSEFRHLSPKRVFLYTLGVCSMIVTFDAAVGLVVGLPKGIPLHFFLERLPVILSLALCVVYVSFPSDLFSFWVTKKLFYGKSRTLIGWLLLIPLDLAISICVPTIPFLALYYGIPQIASTVHLSVDLLFALLGGAIIFSVIISVGLTLLQLTAMLTGLLVRLSVGSVMALSRTAAKVAFFEKYPLKTLMLIFSLLVICVLGVLQLFSLGFG